MKSQNPRRILLSLLAACLLLASAAEARPRQGSRTVKKAPPAAEGVVNINSASAEQLQLLPGIGPSKARAIVRYRGRAKFKTTHQLIRVRGIGRKTYRRLRPYLTVKGPTTLAGKVRQRRRQ